MFSFSQTLSKMSSETVFPTIWWMLYFFENLVASVFCGHQHYAEPQRIKASSTFCSWCFKAVSYRRWGEKRQGRSVNPLSFPFLADCMGSWNKREEKEKNEKGEIFTFFFDPCSFHFLLYSFPPQISFFLPFLFLRHVHSRSIFVQREKNFLFSPFFLLPPFKRGPPPTPLWHKRWQSIEWFLEEVEWDKE